MRVAIVGSRTGIHSEKIKEAVDSLNGEDVVISGGAKGVDREAVKLAKERGLRTVEILPDYLLVGKNAPLVRNEEIARTCDKMIAFWDGKSKGTIHAVNCAKKINKEVKLLILGRDF